MIEIELVASAELPPLGDVSLQKKSNIVIGFGREGIRRCYLSSPLDGLNRQLMLFTQVLGNEPKAFFLKEESSLYIGYDSHFSLVNTLAGNVLAQLDGTVFYDAFFAQNGTNIAVIFETEVVIADNQLLVNERKLFDVIEEYQFDGLNLSVRDIEGKCASFRLGGQSVRPLNDVNGRRAR